MPAIVDGPASPLFRPVQYRGNTSTERIVEAGVSEEMARAIIFAPLGRCVGWGIPFDNNNLIVARDEPVEIEFGPLRTRWLTISHTVDLSEERREPLRTIRFGEMPIELRPPLPIGGHVADYSLLYADGTSERIAIRRQHHINPFTGMWGENCFEAVNHAKPIQTRWGKSDKIANSLWGWGQTQAFTSDMVRLWINNLWSWEHFWHHGKRCLVSPDSVATTPEGAAAAAGWRGFRSVARKSRHAGSAGRGSHRWLSANKNRSRPDHFCASAPGLSQCRLGTNALRRLARPDK
jgi:hypothetical protein